eukprot:scaffold181821_cov29-Tisochrysis_lutea.AAC.2
MRQRATRKTSLVAAIALNSAAMRAIHVVGHIKHLDSICVYVMPASSQTPARSAADTAETSIRSSANTRATATACLSRASERAETDQERD